MKDYKQKDIKRIFCIGHNYSEHIQELGSPDDGNCVIFMKPATSIVAPETSIKIPRDLGAVHHEVELVVSIGRTGKCISKEQALQYVDGFTLGVDLTLRELQNSLKKDGRPWEICKAFDASAPIGIFRKFTPQTNLGNIEISCRVNDELRQKDSTANMLFSVSDLISIISKTWQLLPGDIIFTGTPKGVDAIIPGDTLSIESPQIGKFTWNIT